MRSFVDNLIRGTRSHGLLVVVAAGAALAACSLLVPLNEQQCATNADCAARGGAFLDAVCVNQVCVASTPVAVSDAAVRDAAPVVVVDDAGVDASSEDADIWGCLDDPPEVTSGSAQIAITFNVFDALAPITTAGYLGGSDFTVLADTPVSGIAVESCTILDTACAAQGVQHAVTDDAGQATFTVPGDFDGFFTFQGAGYLPSKLYTGQLLPDASTFAPPVAILATQEASALAAALNVQMELDPEAGVGHAFFQVYDCFDRHAVGVSFTLDIDAGPDTVQWYTFNHFPSTTATSTDDLGAGGAVNVPAGALTVTATLAATQRKIGTVNSVITPGGTTFAWVRVRTR